MNRRLWCLLSVCLFANNVFAGPYDPPANYYNSATGTGATLKQQLHDIIDNHTVRSYGDARTFLQDTDQDPNDPNRMLLVYNRVSLNVSAINPGGSIPGWDSGSSWNREHTWPRSRGVGSSGPDNSDLHQLRPSTPSVNSSRGNLNFGGQYGAQGFGSVSDGGTFWYPGDADAGMIARQQFYMAVRYDGSDSSTTDLELSSGNPGTSSLGNLDRLIQWHYEAAPDDFELRRNDRIYDSYQFNRNPFIDRPEYAWSVLVDQLNDSQITLAGGSNGADGASVLPLDLGASYVGGAGPSTQNVTINKSGNDGTYYSVTPLGDATSSITGSLNAFSATGADSQVVNVGLNTSTATSGFKSGQVAIDNLDVTTGLGSGFGAGDADDTIAMFFTVYDHPVASFSSTVNTSSLTIDLGSIAQGDTAPTAGFSLFNYAGAGAPSFASVLDLDSVLGSGDTGILTTDLLAFNDLSQGSSLGFQAMLDTATVGSFAATYTLDLSGINLPGEQQQSLTLNLIGQVTSSLIPGDANGDGFVDLIDLNILGGNFGTMGGAQFSDGDFNSDGNVDLIDLNILGGNWTGSPPAIAVPEPSTLSALVLLSSLAMLSGSKRQR